MLIRRSLNCWSVELPISLCQTTDAGFKPILKHLTKPPDPDVHGESTASLQMDPISFIFRPVCP